MLNTYSLLFDPQESRAAEVRHFADWLADGDGRQAVENYRVEGRQVFFVWPKDRPADRP